MMENIKNELTVTELFILFIYKNRTVLHSKQAFSTSSPPTMQDRVSFNSNQYFLENIKYKLERIFCLREKQFKIMQCFIKRILISFIF